MLFPKLLMMTLSAAFIAACGGGGDDAGIPPSPIVSADTFQVKTAYVNYFNDTLSYPFRISGTVAGFSVTGSGTVTQSGVTSGLFETAAVLQKTSTITGSYVVNVSTLPISAIVTEFVSLTYAPKGVVGDEYVVVTSSVPIPDTAKVNDTGFWYAANRYSTSLKAIFLGTSEVSYSMQPDTAITALLKIVQVDKDIIGLPVMTTTSLFRITPTGAITRLSETAIEGTSTLTLTY